MPVFSATVIQRVTKTIDGAGNEKVVVDRVIVEKTGIVALDISGAAFTAGTYLKDYDKELLSTVMVKVVQTAA